MAQNIVLYMHYTEGLIIAAEMVIIFPLSWVKCMFVQKKSIIVVFALYPYHPGSFKFHLAIALSLANVSDNTTQDHVSVVLSLTRTEE